MRYLLLIFSLFIASCSVDVGRRVEHKNPGFYDFTIKDWQCREKGYTYYDVNAGICK